MMLQGKTALITGGSRGIGRAICGAYYDQGATLIVMARDEAKLQEACKQIDKDNSGRVFGIACDVGNKESIDAAFVKIKEQFKSLDILVNCAGINIREPLESFSFDSWNKVMDVNLTGPFLITQACFDLMKDKGGKIVNIASLMSEVARPTISAYTASKGGIKMFTRAIAIEWAKYNIQANAIIPGYIATEMNTALIEDEKFNSFICNRTPQGRWGKPEEVAHAAVFFASEGANFITGQCLAVDGGILASL